MRRDLGIGDKRYNLHALTHWYLPTNRLSFYYYRLRYEFSHNQIWIHLFFFSFLVSVGDNFKFRIEFCHNRFPRIDACCKRLRINRFMSLPVSRVSAVVDENSVVPKNSRATSSACIHPQLLNIGKTNQSDTQSVFLPFLGFPLRSRISPIRYLPLMNISTGTCYINVKVFRIYR